MTHDREKKEELVTIKVAEHVLKLAPGIYLVAKLKEMAGLGPDDNLERLVEGRIKPLDDNGKVHIKGDEVFVVCGTGAAS